MLTRRTVVDKIEIGRSGSVQIRFGILIEDDGKEIACEWLRTSVDKGQDLHERLGTVAQQLEYEGFPSVDDISLLEKVVALVQDGKGE